MESFAYKVIKEIAKVVNNIHIETFEVVPTAPKDQNTSPVLQGDGVLGLESWAVRYVLPYAHRIVTSTSLNDDSTRYSNCLLVVNLLNPEMSTAWCRRKELVMQDKSTDGFELTVSRLALSSVPKCNEAFAHRRWILNKMGDGSHAEMSNELDLTLRLADKYPSNYHAWCHRQWCLRNQGKKFTSVLLVNLLPSVIPLPVEVVALLFNTSNMAILLKDLQYNFDFISRHVSDHSGMHHRSFLLQEILRLARITSTSRYLNQANVTADLKHEAITFYGDLQQEIADFLSDCQESSVKEYVANLGPSFTFFDLAISLILKDLRSNMTLNKIYEYHESLWCYRRFLVYTFCHLNAENRQFSEILTNCFLNLFTFSEQTYLNELVEKKGDFYDGRIVKNYYNWLRRETKLNIVLSVEL